MKNFLLAIIALAIVVMPYTYFYNPTLKTAFNQKQEIANLQGSLSRFEGNRMIAYRELLETQKTNLEKETRRLNFMLPAFANARANLMGPFDRLREAIPGEWEVVPEGKFTVSGPLVFWEFRFKYVGTTADAVKVLASMEVSTQIDPNTNEKVESQFMRLNNFKMDTNGKLVTLSGRVEVVFQEKPMEVGGKK